MKKTLYLRQCLKPFAVACLLILSSCSSDEVLPADDSQGKTPIKLAAGIVGGELAQTRSVVTIEDNPEAFSVATYLYMVMKSEDKTSSATTMYTRTRGEAPTNQEGAVNFSGKEYNRHWEDAIKPNTRNSMLSVYAACVPGKKVPFPIGGASTYNVNKWSSTAIEATVTWPLALDGGAAPSVAEQSSDFLGSQDLCFSNNISNLSGNSPADNRIGYLEGDKKFDESKKMIFYHALTMVTFNIVKNNEDFESSETLSFSKSDENVKLIGFNTGGTFDIIQGEFTGSPTTATINKLAGGTDAGGLTATGLLVPGTDLNVETANQVLFTVNQNEYHLTKKQLMDALSGKYLSNHTTTTALTYDHKMRAGVNYIFTLVIGKTKVDNITAAVVPWETVNASETTASNVWVNLSLLDNGDKKTGTADFDLYRTTVTTDNNYDWSTGYNDSGNKATLSWDGTNNHYNTIWTWPDINTYYHLRVVSPTMASVTTDASDSDYFSIEKGSVPGTYTDFCWGAPFYATVGNVDTPLHNTKLTYLTTTGFDETPSGEHQISKAIGPSGTINMEMFHMMSDVTIIIKTTSGNDASVLYDGTTNPAKTTTIELSNIYPTAKVRLGNGLVEADGTRGAVTPAMTWDDVNKQYTMEHFGFVPQDLTDVVLTITTADHNQSTIAMKDVVSSGYTNTLIANPYTATGNKVDRWYPNFKYVYTFVLSKSGIANFTATLANWETVTAGDDHVQIQ